jgi:plasmid stabilization system protein ParE
MKKYNVVITASALKDMEDLYNYIAYELYSPDSAKKLYFKIANAIQSLELFAERYRVFSNEDGYFTRRMLVDNYSVFYIIKGSNVIITSVLYSSRDLNEVLKSNI